MRVNIWGLFMYLLLQSNIAENLFYVRDRGHNALCPLWGC